MLFFHILGFFGILIPLVYLAPHQSAKEVFGTFYNGGDWSTSGLSFFVGLVTAMDAFLGLDAADHIRTNSLGLSWNGHVDGMLIDLQRKRFRTHHTSFLLVWVFPPC